jgi:radical SAM superfamily enzyme YgiQ (UPF0313 family)
MVKVVFTADRTLMSEYNKHVFMGFAACSPKFIPGWIYKKIFCPPVDQDGNKRAKFGHCGQRKIEASLLNNGFNEEDVAVVPPERLKRVIDKETKILCITTHDPLGLGPASTTLGDLAGRESFTSFYFRKLISNPIIRKFGLKVLVGGSGAWQLTDVRIMAKLGIDCVVVGEGEITAVKLIESALNGNKLPSIVEGEVVPLEEIPIIKKPTLNGIIEICRGCGRGCKFCTPTMMAFRSIPLERILEEVRLNVAAGNGAVFHAEDVLRYKANGFSPNENEVFKLFSEVRKLSKNIGISHFAHASVTSKPGLIEKLSELMEIGTKEFPFISGQVGIETGSTRIVSKYMKGKAKPFKPEDWPEMIVESHKILSDNNWVPAETVIMGLPGEKPEDIQDTIDLIKDLSEYKSLIVPLNFVPIGSLQGNGFFRAKDALPEHWQLLATCINHDFKWIYKLAEENLPTVGMSGWKIWALKKIIRYVEKRLRPYVKLMEEGISPITNRLT